MTDLDSLPVIIGAGQDSRPVPDDLDTAFGPVSLAATALKRAFADAGIDPQPIDLCLGVRQFGDSGPAFPNPFGGSNNVPASICARAGIQAKRHVYDSVGGQTPQTLVGEAARLLMQGRVETVAIVGAEAIANIKAASRAGAKPDWSERRDEALEDRGAFDPNDLPVSMQALAHRIAAPVYYYGLMECARRAALGVSRESYQDQMAAIWQEFSAVAATHPFAVQNQAKTGPQIVTPSVDNPLICTPYTKAMIARDRVNQGAAVVMTRYGKARQLGVKDVTFLHGHDQGGEPTLLERPRLDRSRVQQAVLTRMGQDATLYDLYSCFPIVPFEACRILDLGRDSVKTLTGGLPFFGGPGNNYSLHAIAQAHAQVRGTDQVAVIYANGGMASKHAVGRYSGIAPDSVSICDSGKATAPISIETDADPSGIIAAYTVEYRRGEPTGVLLIGETASGSRFYARAGAEHAQTFTIGDPLGAAFSTQTTGGQNLLTRV